MYIGRNKCVPLVHRNFLIHNKKLEHILDSSNTESDATKRLSFCSYHNSPDSEDDVEWEEGYNNILVILKLLLNLSTEKEFHLAICERFTSWLVGFAFENDYSFSKESGGWNDEVSVDASAGADADGDSRRFLIDELAILSCKILSNLEKSSNRRICLRLYKEQLKLVKHVSTSPKKKEKEDQNIGVKKYLKQVREEPQKNVFDKLILTPNCVGSLPRVVHALFRPRLEEGRDAADFFAQQQEADAGVRGVAVQQWCWWRERRRGRGRGRGRECS